MLQLISNPSSHLSRFTSLFVTILSHFVQSLFAHLAIKNLSFLPMSMLAILTIPLIFISQTISVILLVKRKVSFLLNAILKASDNNA